MSQLVKHNPTEVTLLGFDLKQLGHHLSYSDLSVEWEYHQFKKSARWRLPQIGPEAFETKLEELKAARKATVLRYKEDGTAYTYSGLADWLSKKFEIEIETKFVYPERVSCPWENIPEGKDRYYQTEAFEALVKHKHACVEMGTGLGKSRIAQMLLKHYGLPALIGAPSINIADQLYRSFVSAFGKSKVGRFYKGKKESSKRFVVAVTASLTKVEEGDAHWNNLQSKQVLIGDESHLWAAKTLVKICFGVAALAPYRFFFSGTQMRGDGKDLLLSSITGPIVYKMSVAEGVDQGFLGRPLFRMVYIPTTTILRSSDPQKITQKLLYNNPEVIEAASYIANLMLKMNRQVLILVDEVEQFTRLLPNLNGRVAFAHGGLTKNNRGKVPPEYHKSDPVKLVADFNNGELDILVGTSCVSTGTDIKTVGAGIFLRGGKSEVDVKQSVGRCTRGGDKGSVERPEKASYWAWKDKKLDCYFWDFDVYNPHEERQLLTSKHAKVRVTFYEDIYGPVKISHFDGADNV